MTKQDGFHSDDGFAIVAWRTVIKRDEDERTLGEVRTYWRIFSAAGWL
jgi:hypothetical protein